MRCTPRATFVYAWLNHVNFHPDIFLDGLRLLAALMLNVTVRWPTWALRAAREDLEVPCGSTVQMCPPVHREIEQRS